MAAAFRAAGAVNQGTTGAVSLALPAGIAINDILILVASTIAAGSITITTTGGWTWNAVTGSPVDVTAGEKLYVWWARRVTGTETAPSITPGGDHSIGRLAAYSGCLETGSPINVQAAGSEATSDTTFSFATGISTTFANCLVLCACSTGTDTTTAQFTTMANTSLTALAERFDNETTNGGGGGFSLCEGLRAATGTCGTFTSTLTTASPKAYIAFALRPQLKTLKTVTGSMPNPTGGIVRKTSKKPVGAFGFAGAVARSTLHFKTLTGPLSFSGAISKAKKTLKAIAGILAFTGTAAHILTRKRALTGTLSATGTVRKWTRVKRAGVASFTGAVARSTRRAKLVAGVLSFSGAMKRKTGRVVSGAMAFTGGLARKVSHRLMGALSFAGSVAGEISSGFTQVIAGALSFAGSLRVKVSKNLSGAFSFTGSFGKMARKRLAGFIDFLGSIAQLIIKPGEAIHLSGAFTRSVTMSGSFTRAIAISGKITLSISCSGRFNHAVELAGGLQ